MAAGRPRENQQPRPIYVVLGKDEYLIAQQCEKLIAALLEPAQRQTALSIPDLEKADPTDILDELRTPSLFASRSVVLLKQADDFISQNRGLLEKYFDHPSHSGVLILTVGTWPSNTRLAKKLKKVGRLVQIRQLKSYQLPDYAARYAQDKHNKRLDTQSARLLVELVGDEPGRLCSEVDKLALYVGTKKSITTEHIEALTGRNRIFNAFQVIDAMTSGDTGRAVERLRRMFDADNSAPYTAVGAFAYHFRKLFTATALLKKGLPGNQICGRLNVKYHQQDFLKQAQRLGFTGAGRMLAELAGTDYQIKTGQTSPQIAIEQFVVRFATQH